MASFRGGEPFPCEMRAPFGLAGLRAVISDCSQARGGRKLPTLMSPLIELDGLVRLYGERPAGRGISLTVPPGEIFGLLGPNGAGKSTTIKMLATLLLPSAGTARIAGYDLVSQAHEVRT